MAIDVRILQGPGQGQETAAVQGGKHLDRPSQFLIALDPSLRMVALIVKPVDAFGVVPENEDVLRADLIPDFDVGAIQGPDRQGPIESGLHVAGAGSFHTGG